VSASAVEDLLALLQDYARARAEFLAQIERPTSCRDPLAEFSEVLVARLLNAECAGRRDQKGFDLIRPDNRRVQVKYLSNPDWNWRNEHTIDFTGGCDDYALVIIVDFRVEAVLVFPRESIARVYTVLGKRHRGQGSRLLFTRRNCEVILESPAKFQELGVEVYRLGLG